MLPERLSVTASVQGKLVKDSGRSGEETRVGFMFAFSVGSCNLCITPLRLVAPFCNFSIRFKHKHLKSNGKIIKD